MADTAYKKLFDAALLVEQERPTKAELLEMAAGCTGRQLNRVIKEVSTVAKSYRDDSRNLYQIAEILSDEVRRRVEALELAGE